MTSTLILSLTAFIISTHAYEYPCGYLTRPYGTIRGGIRADPGAWPWIASISVGVAYAENPSRRLRLSADRGREHICAGTMVGRKFVITAGHCLYDGSRKRKPSELLVITGTQTLDLPFTSPKESVSGVKKIYFHPKYRSKHVRPWAYDLAVIELKTAPTYEDVSRPACLPIDNVPPKDGESCLVAGWGKTENARFSRVLMQADVPIVSRRECNAPRFWNNYIDKSMLCALNQKAGRASACQGDSGGPLLCERDGQYFLYGVISWGPIICGDKPAVFTNVAYVSDWLLSILEEAGEHVDPGNHPERQKPQSNEERNSNNPSRPPCDAAVFERKHGWVLYGPAPIHYELSDVSIRECMNQCCLRGKSDCQSFVYYHSLRVR